MVGISMIEVLVMLVVIQALLLSAWLWMAYKRMKERRRHLEKIDSKSFQDLS